MPKIIELTVEIAVQSVSCPGVWLCQDGRVSLTVFTLGTSYQTCLLPPVFPLLYRDSFFFRKRYQETCALNNICCLMKDETIYCELVQWSEGCCSSRACTILAQYLGSLNEMLFPPSTCFNDGVDLLMRRCKDFPGILSPKIEVSTKVRIDEVVRPTNMCPPPARPAGCACAAPETHPRQKAVCHTPVYHKHKCQNEERRARSAPKVRPRSAESSTGRSTCSVRQQTVPVRCCGTRKSPLSWRRPCSYDVYTVQTPDISHLWNDVMQGQDTIQGHNAEQGQKVTQEQNVTHEQNLQQLHVKKGLQAAWGQNHIPITMCPAIQECNMWSDKLSNGRILLEDRTHEDETMCQANSKFEHSKPAEDSLKVVLESRCIHQEEAQISQVGRKHRKKVTPCVCEICQKYHDLFHAEG